MLNLTEALLILMINRADLCRKKECVGKNIIFLMLTGLFDCLVLFNIDTLNFVY